MVGKLDLEALGERSDAAIEALRPRETEHPAVVAVLLGDVPALLAEVADLRRALKHAHVEGLRLMSDGDTWAIPPEKQGDADRWSHDIREALAAAPAPQEEGACQPCGGLGWGTSTGGTWTCETCSGSGRGA